MLFSINSVNWCPFFKVGKNPDPLLLPGASKFCPWASESLVALWASEISLSGRVSLNENVSLINDNFQPEAISKLRLQD